MKILYVITTYNPGDKNPLYFDDGSYVYTCIHRANKIKLASKHDIDIVVSDFSSGKRTRDKFLERRKVRGWSVQFLFGETDECGIVAINSATVYKKASQNYDLVFYSVSDALCNNVRSFDDSVDKFVEDSDFDFMYIDASPGLVLPREKMDMSWYQEMPFYRNVHFNVCCVKNKFLKSYNNRLFIDIFEGASVEPFVGYMCYAQGGCRRICPVLKFEHMGQKMYTDRKHIFTKGVKARGGGWCVPSKHLKRDLNHLLYGGSESHIHYTPKEFSEYKHKKDHTKQDLLLMYRYICENLFLKQDELDYSKIQISEI